MFHPKILTLFKAAFSGFFPAITAFKSSILKSYLKTHDRFIEGEWGIRISDEGEIKRMVVAWLELTFRHTGFVCVCVHACASAFVNNNNCFRFRRGSDSTDLKRF